MAETVGQHSVAAFTSPVNGTTPIDANSVRGNDNTMRSAYVDHDADPGIHVQSSTLASRPVAGTAGRKWVTVSSGRYQFWYDDGTRWHEIASDAINVDCLADANLAKGDVVKITGFNNGQNLPTVNKVTASTDVAFGVVENTVTSGNLVQIVNTGLIEDVDTNGYAVGTILYPNTSGGWTTTKPTSGNYQPAGFVLRGNTNNGVLYVEFSAPRIVERSNNEASTIVLRDASGNFAAGTITAGALTSTGLVTFASLKGTGATTVTNILDEDNMASDSATALATQQSIKAYVDTKVATVDTLAEVLANGNTTGATDIIVTAGQKITTDTIAETTAAAGVTIDSVLLKDDVVNATDIEVDTISANNGTLAVTLGSTGVATIAQQPILSSLTASQAVFTDASKGLVSNAITGTGNVVMSASPTLTGTVTAATINATTLGGTLSTAAQTNITSVGTLTGLTVTNPITGSVTGSSGSTTGNAATATALQTARNINGVSFNGTADITVTAAAGTLTGTTLASGVTASSLTSVGTLSSLTVSGDLTVDTSTLKVDSANNYVGIGTTSPDYDLQVEKTVAAGSVIANVYNPSNTGAARLYLGNDGNVGAARFQVFGSSHAIRPSIVTIGSEASLPLVFDTAGAEKMRLDTSGNLGLGVTPSAWGGGVSGLQVKDSTMLAYAGTNGYIGANAYYGTSGGTGFKYYGTGVASLYAQEGAVHKWFTAASGSANAAITFTQAMTLDASGYLTLNGAANDGRIQLSNTARATASGLWVGVDATQSYVLSRGSYPLTFFTDTTERARITSGGYFKASNTGAYNDTTGSYHEFLTDANAQILRLQSSNASYTSTAVQILAARNTTNNTFYALDYYNTGASAFKFRVADSGDVTNTNGTYGTISDAKLKHNIVDAGSQWDDIKAIRFRKYQMIDDPSQRTMLGVVAQELESVSPGLVEEHADTEQVEMPVLDEDGNETGETTTETRPTGTVTKSVKTSVLLMKAAVALQEAMARIEALEASNAGLLARLEALEA